MNTPEEIIEGNKLIATFLNWKIGYGDMWAKPAFGDGFNAPKGDYKSGDRRRDDQLEFHYNWSWLMSVVEKISGITIEGHPPFTGDQFVRVEIVPNGYVKIENLRDTPIFTNVSKRGSLIAAIWHAVVQFIRWYNTVPR